MLKTVNNRVELYSKQGFKVCLQKRRLRKCTQIWDRNVCNFFLFKVCVYYYMFSISYISWQRYGSESVISLFE